MYDQYISIIKYCEFEDLSIKIHEKSVNQILCLFTSVQQAYYGITLLKEGSIEYLTCIYIRIESCPKMYPVI
jgi:hypothetical protein